MPITVSSLRRYPVKSMGGEALQSIELDARGFKGDRVFAVRDSDNRLASGKNTRRMVRRDSVFAFAASTTADGVRVTGPGVDLMVGDGALDAHLSTAMGAQVAVAPETDVPHFDEGSVSLIGTATLQWCAHEFGVDADPRRLRANIVVQTGQPFEEESWEGDISIGSAVLRPAGRIERCRTIDLPQDEVAERTRWLKPLGQKRDMRVAIYLDVSTPGVISVGDAARHRSRSTASPLPTSASSLGFATDLVSVVRGGLVV